MKFTLSWLKQHLNTNASVTEIADTLTRIGLEVDALENPAEKLSGFVVAEVREAAPHPNADRLKVCRVFDGTKELKIVCGAPNCRTGLKVVLAPVGAVIPKTREPLKLGKIRGEESQGMCCAYSELELDGGPKDIPGNIIELPAGAVPGTPAAEALGNLDTLFEINLTPNRGDCASVRGIARDLAAAGLGTLKPLPAPKFSETFKSPIRVRIDAPSNFCPAFAGRYIRGVKNGPSPEWLQRELAAVGQKSISALVDITNYFTFVYGRPLHAFDADKVSGNELVVRMAKDGETYEALNNKDYVLESWMAVIADADEADALCGIMGGRKTMSEDTTVNLFLEAALWDPINVARMGRTLQIHSDARYRFERGVDPAFAVTGLNLATQMVIDLCGGEASELVFAGKTPNEQREYVLRSDRVKTLGGLDLPIARQQKILEDLGFKIMADKNALRAAVPSWRSDILGEADLVEEILRIHGFEHVPTVSLPRDFVVPPPAVNDGQRRLLRARRVLAAQGLLESVTWSFVTEKEAALFGGGAPALKLVNPISTEMSDMRPTPLPGLLAALVRNFARGIPCAGLFEIGPAYLGVEPNDQRTLAAWVRSPMPVRHWQGAGSADVMSVKADLFAVLTALGQPTELPVTRQVPAHYHPGRSGAIFVGKNPIAYFGELHPEICALYDFKTAPMMAEIILDNLPPAKKKGSAKPMLDASALQPIVRDFAFLVPDPLLAADLVRAVKLVDRPLITAVDVFDVYAGKGMVAGEKSIAISVTLQPRDKTLTDAEIETIAKAVITAAEKLGGRIR